MLDDHASSPDPALRRTPERKGTECKAARRRIRVLLPLPLPEALDYLLPEDILAPDAGSFVRVPLGGRSLVGVVWDGAGEELPAERLKPIHEILSALKLRAEYAPRSAEVVNEVARLYAARFTEQELNDTLAFYKSPLGRKLLVEEPSILDQSMRNAQSWADRLSQEVIGKIRAEMKRRGHEI